MDYRIIILLILGLASCNVKKNIQSKSYSESNKEDRAIDSYETTNHNEVYQQRMLKKTLSDRGTWISFDGLTSISIDESGNINATADRATVYSEQSQSTQESDDRDRIISNNQNSKSTERSFQESSFEQSEKIKQVDRNAVAGWTLCLIILFTILFLYLKKRM